MPTEKSTTSSSLEKITTSSWRRFSDFEWIMNTITEEFPGLIVPTPVDKATSSDGMEDKLKDLAHLPKDGEKEAEEKDKDMAVTAPHGIGQKRLRQLQLTMNVLSVLPNVTESPTLMAFLSLSESKWLDFKDQHKKNVITKVKKGVSSLFDKIKHQSVQKVGAYDETTKIGKIAEQQRQYSRQLDNLEGHIGTIRLSDNRKEIKDAKKHRMSQVTHACKKLPYPSLYIQHRVTTASSADRTGTITYIDDADQYAFIDWEQTQKDGKSKRDKKDKEMKQLKHPVSQVPTSELLCPSSGISDVSVEVVLDFIDEMDKWTYEMPERASTKQFLFFVDLLRFWKSYTNQLVVVVGKMRDLCQEKENLSQELKKTSNREKQVELQNRISQCDIVATERRFMESYETVYRPAQQAALRKMCRMTGELSLGMGICDIDWPTRLEKANRALPLSFEIPEDVAQMLLSQGATASDDEKASPLPKEKKSKKDKKEAESLSPSASRNTKGAQGAQHSDPSSVDAEEKPKKEKKSKKKKTEDMEDGPVEAEPEPQPEQDKVEKKEKKKKEKTSSSKKYTSHSDTGLVDDNMSFDNVEPVAVL